VKLRRGVSLQGCGGERKGTILLVLGLVDLGFLHG